MDLSTYVWNIPFFILHVSTFPYQILFTRNAYVFFLVEFTNILQCRAGIPQLIDLSILCWVSVSTVHKRS